MHKIKFFIAILSCKALLFVSKILKKGGSSLPGEIALKICPDILTHLAKQVKKEIVAVCGTNGKTTTNNLLYSFLTSSGSSVVCNNVGANMIYGVCCAFIKKCNIFGKLNADYAALEIDEASCVKVFKYFAPDKMIITNLFRDQLDRYGEIDATINLLKDALKLAPKTELILNADDPLVAQFGVNTDRTCYFVGIDEKVLEEGNETKEGRFCSVCGEKLDYEYYHYSQLGKYKCSGCSFERPKTDFSIRDVELRGGIKWNLYTKNECLPFFVNYKGFYNIYNIALSYCATHLVLSEVCNYQKVLDDYMPQTGRMEEFIIGNKKVVLNLSKNPAGFNQAIATLTTDESKKALLLGINDNAGDGKDVSWLWDVDFEKLSEFNIESFVVCGKRADDMALRLKYAGILEENIKKADSLLSAAQILIENEAENCYALVNYTVVFKMQEILKELSKGEGK